MQTPFYLCNTKVKYDIESYVLFSAGETPVRKRYALMHCRRLYFAPSVQPNFEVNLPCPFWAGICPFPLQNSEVGGFASVSWFSSTPDIPAILNSRGWVTRVGDDSHEGRLSKSRTCNLRTKMFFEKFQEDYAFYS